MNAEGLSSPLVETTVRDLTQAIGGLAAVFAAHLGREGLASTGKIADQLGLFATITAETSPMPGAILAYWSDVVGQAIGPDAGTSHDR